MKFKLLEAKDLIKIPDDVKILAEIADSNNIKLYVVGGAVRDFLMGKIPKDWDLTTPTIPENITKIYEDSGLHVIPTGLKHGTVSVVLNGEVYEITTFRTDKNVGEGHKEVEHEFVDDINLDLSRRDLTINSMAYDISENKLIDPFKGQEDLQNGIIRTVGDPDDKFIGKEYGDPLRILRIFRFAARYGFKIEDNIMESIKKNKHSIKTVSNERIKDEMEKILMSNKPSKVLRMMKDTEFLEVIFPEIQKSYGFPQDNPNHIYDVFEHIIRTLDHAKPIPEVRWSLFLHDIGKPETRGDRHAGGDSFLDHAEKSHELSIDILNRLKFDNKSKNMILSLIKHHDLFAHLNPKKSVKFKRKMRELIPSRKDWWKEFETSDDDLEQEKDMSIFDRLENIHFSDTSAQNPELFDKKKQKRDNVMKKYRDIIYEKEPLYISDIAISGKDIMKELDIPGGKKIGEIQLRLLDLVTHHPEYNTKEKLISKIRQWEGLDIKD